MLFIYLFIYYAQVQRNIRHIRHIIHIQNTKNAKIKNIPNILINVLSRTQWIFDSIR